MEKLELTYGKPGTRRATRPTITIEKGTKVRTTRPLRMKAFGTASSVRVRAGRVGTVVKITGKLVHIRFGGPETFTTDFSGSHATLFQLVEGRD